MTAVDFQPLKQPPCTGSRIAGTGCAVIALVAAASLGVLVVVWAVATAVRLIGG